VVIEGYVDPSETVTEGPFGNHTGFYSPAGAAALLRVTAISHRAGAVIPATVVGPPPMEDCWMAQVWERLLPAFLRKLIPSVAEIHFPLEWVFHQSAIISLENPSPGMVREVAAALWDTPWFSEARLIMFINADTDPGGHGRAAWRGINLADFGRDLFHDDTRQRTALDATGSGVVRPGPAADPETVRNVIRRWHEYGI
jgi:4-hydroxy-3-polyprenylbenzoate decarboxylase